MTWYYAVGNERQGPVDDATLDRLIATGTVTPDTLVWKAGMADWQPLSQARPRITPASAPVVPPPPAALTPSPAPTPTPAPAPTDPSTQPRFGSPIAPRRPHRRRPVRPAAMARREPRAPAAGTRPAAPIRRRPIGFTRA